MIDNPIKEQGISVVIPVYNEEENVETLANEIVAALGAFPLFEIVMVDDLSKDDTLNCLKALKTTIPQLSIVQHANNMGQSAAVVSGVKAAKYPWIATLDGDGQNNPADIPKLIEQMQEQLQQGHRKVLCMGYRQKRNDNSIRKISSKVANNVRTAFLKDDCPDSGCGIKLFNKHLFLQLPHFRNCHRFLPALFKRAGAVVINVPVSHRERTKGVSKYGVFDRLWVGIVDLIGVAWLTRRPIDTDVSHDPS